MLRMAHVISRPVLVLGMSLLGAGALFLGLFASRSGNGAQAEPSTPRWPQQRSAELRLEQLPAPWEGMKGLFTPKLAPAANDWLARHPERGQSLAQFQADWKDQPRQAAGFVDIVRIGKFSTAETVALDAACAHIEATLGVRTRQLASLGDETVLAAGRRQNPQQGQLQFHTGWIHTQVLRPRLRKDSICLLGFTATDLYPSPDWNYVFGVAYPADGIGLWSIARNGNAEGTAEERRLFLHRTMSTATHETGHLFAMDHCLAYECLMNGANHRSESDSKALALCPCCSAKMSWLWCLNPAQSLLAQLKVCRQHEQQDAVKLLEAQLKVLQVPIPPPQARYRKLEKHDIANR